MKNVRKAGDAPIPCQLEADKNYAWCSCGFSSDQPFCNGNHKKEDGTDPVIFKVEEAKEAYLRTCKQTKNPPYCDGSHKN